jgi:F420-non-reducing hydrogenase iron-sulfur subunit
MCSGRVDPLMIAEAFYQGCDGVMGCRLGECHYISGNYQAQARVLSMKRLLERKIGISPERLFNDWVSTAEDERIVRFITEFTEKIRKLGPLGVPEGVSGEELKSRLSQLKYVLQSKNIRWLVGREKEILTEGNVFGEKVAEEDFEILLDEVIVRERKRGRIRDLLAEQPLSVEEIARKVELPPHEVLRDVVALNRQGLVVLDKVEDDVPYYIGVKT